MCCLLILKHGLSACLPTFKDKELIKFIWLYSGGSVWRSEAAFGTVAQCNAIVNRALLCIVIFINGFMQKSFDISGVTGTAFSRFPCYIQSVPQGGFLCSPEHGKLCFEALETELVPQNNLPFAGGRKHLPKSGFCMDFKMDL
ncbi:hypothetical protein DC487_04470 [Sphingobacterium corticibacter]|uniref:Uncharacterized protein n=1 Tax=Sphingobacterium corticibacter TaxID=2171749 RepID=A0A2T8HN42_9SPHI|nr:hypothetical protein DC487_04470 [Sphingobacterium corticibacter]